MTEQEIKEVLAGDIIMWYREPDGWCTGWYAYGRVCENGSLFCDKILGDGDSNIGKDEIFVCSEPGWVDISEIRKLDEVDDRDKIAELNNIFGKLCECPYEDC